MDDYSYVPFIWLILGCVLLILEVLGTAGFLIGAGVAALGMAIVVFLYPDISLVMQVVLFAIAALLASFVYFKFFRKLQPSNKNELPSRISGMVGTRFKLAQALDADEQIRVQIGDTMWQVASATPIEAGTQVQVIGGHQMTLTIEAVP